MQKLYFWVHVALSDIYAGVLDECLTFTVTLYDVCHSYWYASCNSLFLTFQKSKHGLQVSVRLIQYWTIMCASRPSVKACVSLLAAVSSAFCTLHTDYDSVGFVLSCSWMRQNFVDDRQS